MKENSFLQWGFGTSRVKGACHKGSETVLRLYFYFCLIEGKHSGIKIGHEQQKFGNKKISNKKDYIITIGNSLKKKKEARINEYFKSFSCKEYFQKVHSKTKIPSCTNIFQALGLKYIFIYNTPM